MWAISEIEGVIELLEIALISLRHEERFNPSSISVNRANDAIRRMAEAWSVVDELRRNLLHMDGDEANR